MSGQLQDVRIRRADARDTDALTSLWSAVFGDPEELAASFLSLLPEMGSGCVAECGGRILGAAYLIHGYHLLCPGEAPLRCGYLYAVAVDGAFRGHGLGSALSRGAAAFGREAGAEQLFTLPAEDSLYAWYEDILSLRFRCTRTVYRCDALPAAGSLSAAEYLRQREEILRDRPHAVPEPAVMEFQRRLCETCGGGLYASDNLLFCAYRDGQEWFLPELLPREGAAPLPPAFRPVTRPYLCSDAAIPDGLVWNLTLD